MGNLDKCRLAAMLVLRHSHLPSHDSPHHEKEGRASAHQICCPDNGGPLGVPHHLQFVPVSFRSMLGSMPVCSGTFSMGTVFFLVEEISEVQLLAITEAFTDGIETTSLCLPWSHLRVGCLNSGASSTSKVLHIIWSFSLSFAI